ncbi:MAG: hypothetical protein JW723_00895 [Bacteroidales bacterium]|nr:hypothetical protein [Bacteroidales bacterium]
MLKAILYVEYFDRKRLKNLFQNCSETVYSEKTPEVAASVFFGNSSPEGGSLYE